ncbi:MAG: hypothetical protein C0476_12435 [Sphingomonas sp.]|nr:hypothetical protein [Sphingomonas sp.]
MALAIAPTVAQTPLPFTDLLGQASDNALSKLGQPGAFYADEAVRIALPGPLRQANGILKFTDRAGLTTGVTKSLNDAAGQATNAAKPIFRTAISKLSIRDVPALLTRSDGATNFLRETAGAELRAKMRPLIVTALGKTGAFAQMDKLSRTTSLLGRVGISRDTLSDSVTDQAMGGIFNYMGREEAKLRANPLDLGRKLLGGN